MEDKFENGTYVSMKPSKFENGDYVTMRYNAKMTADDWQTWQSIKRANAKYVKIINRRPYDRHDVNYLVSYNHEETIVYATLGESSLVNYCPSPTDINHNINYIILELKNKIPKILSINGMDFDDFCIFNRIENEIERQNVVLSFVRNGGLEQNKNGKYLLEGKIHKTSTTYYMGGMTSRISKIR